MRLSVLDQSASLSGRPQDASIRETLALAQHCEALGYDRFWVSEHHNHPAIVGTAPEVLMAAMTRMAERESPPRSKNESSTPTRSNPSTWA